MGHFTAKAIGTRALKLAGVLACVASLGGCGAVEFEGKVFDYMGISGTRQEADVQMTERPPLLVPPNLNTLPAPSQGVAVATARQDWPDDPEKVRTRVIAEQKARDAEAEAKADPLNAYAGRETLLDKLLARSKTVEEPIPDVPEPDASDRLPESGAVAQSSPQALRPHVPQAPLPNRNDEDFAPVAPGSYQGVSGGQNDHVGF